MDMGSMYVDMCFSVYYFLFWYFHALSRLKQGRQKELSVSKSTPNFQDIMYWVAEFNVAADLLERGN